MYEKKSYSLFKKHTTFYKDGHLHAWHEEDGSWQFVHPGKAPVTMTRSQGFRYWLKHFPDRPCWMLPPLIAAAVDISPEIESEVLVYERDSYIHHGMRG